MTETQERLPKPQRRNSRTNRRHIENLERRAKVLGERLDLYDDLEGDPSRTIAERKALQWAIEIAREWMDNDPLIDYDWRGTEFTDAATVEDALSMIGTRGVLRGRLVRVVDARLIRPTDLYDQTTIRLTLEVMEDEEAWTKAEFVPVKVDKTT